MNSSENTQDYCVNSVKPLHSKVIYGIVTHQILEVNHHKEKAYQVNIAGTYYSYAAWLHCADCIGK
jgi:hypothetical protein